MTDHDLAHDRLQESAGLYVLGALDPREHAEFEAHMATCALCTNEVRALRSVAAALPHGLPSIDPPPHLRDKVLAVTRPPAHAQPAIAPASDNFAPTPAPARRWSGVAGWLTAAALLIVSTALWFHSTSLRQQVADLRAELGDAIARLQDGERQLAVARRSLASADAQMAVLSAPDVARVNLQGQAVAPQASGRAFWSRARGLVFTASNLPQTPQGRSYQVWVVTAEAPVSAGLLQLDTAGSTTQAFATPPDIPTPVAIAVTIEPAGGAPAPTGEKYLVGTTH